MRCTTGHLAVLTAMIAFFTAAWIPLPWGYPDSNSARASFPAPLPPAPGVPRPFKESLPISKGKFLIAGRKLADPNFSQTVVLLIDYAPEGAMGVVINRPTRIKLSGLLPEIKEFKDRPDTVFIGGPVERGRLILLVRTAAPPEKAFNIFEDVYVTGDVEPVRRMIERPDAKESFKAYAGYAGWGPGQLEGEMARGDWHLHDADAATVFDKPASKIWPDLILRFSSQWVRQPTPQAVPVF